MTLLPFAFALLVSASAGSGSPPGDTALSPFRLEDQRGKEHVDGEYRGRVLIVLGSDRAGSAYNEVWGRALGDSLRGSPGSDEPVFLGIADTRNVPKLMHGFIRRGFPKDRTVLMDWQGELARRLEFEEKATNVLVFDREGRLVHRAACREMDAGALRVILAKTRPLLNPS